MTQPSLSTSTNYFATLRFEDNSFDASNFVIWEGAVTAPFVARKSGDGISWTSAGTFQCHFITYASGPTAKDTMNNTGGSFGCMSNTDRDYGAGSNWTTGSAYTLVQINAYLKKSGSPTKNMVIDVWTESGSNPATLLATSDPVAASTLTTSYAAITFTFSLDAAAYSPNPLFFGGGL